MVHTIKTGDVNMPLYHTFLTIPSDWVNYNNGPTGINNLDDALSYAMDTNYVDVSVSTQDEFNDIFTAFPGPSSSYGCITVKSNYKRVKLARNTGFYLRDALDNLGMTGDYGTIVLEDVTILGENSSIYWDNVNITSYGYGIIAASGTQLTGINVTVNNQSNDILSNASFIISVIDNAQLTNCRLIDLDKYASYGFIGLYSPDAANIYSEEKYQNNYSYLFNCSTKNLTIGFYNLTNVYYGTVSITRSPTIGMYYGFYDVEYSNNLRMYKDVTDTNVATAYAYNDIRYSSNLFIEYGGNCANHNLVSRTLLNVDNIHIYSSSSYSGTETKTTASPYMLGELIKVNNINVYARDFTLEGTFMEGCEEVSNIQIDINEVNTDYMFNWCRNISNLNIRVRSVYDTAVSGTTYSVFYDSHRCDNIEIVTVTRTDVEAYMFNNCSDINNVYINNSSTKGNLFYNTDRLSNINVKFFDFDSKTVFDSCDFISNTKIYNPDSNDYGYTGFDNCKYISSCFAEGCKTGYNNCDYISNCSCDFVGSTVCGFNGCKFVSSSLTTVTGTPTIPNTYVCTESCSGIELTN